MSKRRAGHALAIIVGLLMAGIHPSVAGGEEKTAATQIEAMANLPRKGTASRCEPSTASTTWCRTRARKSNSASGES